MKILVAHNKYQQAGGEDSVVSAEIELLRSNGHDVHLWSVDNQDLPGGIMGKINTAISATYSVSSKTIANDKLRNFKPDIVHVHNFFPQISPSVYDACADAKVPVVQTLHNYRLICAGALLMRDGKICELCITGSPYQAALYGCYRNSKIGSLAVAHMVDQHRKKQTWNQKVNRFIALTEFAKSKFVQAGFPEEKISVKPNFVNSHWQKASKPPSTEPYALFIGRLSEEKGIKTLAKAWQIMDAPCQLKVAGDGPLRPLLENIRTVETLGFLNQDVLHQLLEEAAFLIVPSEWYEGFPMVLVEAFSHGKPVIASNLGSLAEIIVESETGLLFEAGNATDLAKKMSFLINNPEEAAQMGNKAKEIFETKYTPKQNLDQLLSIYYQAIQKN